MTKAKFIKVFLGVLKLQLDKNLPEETSDEKYTELAWLSIGQLKRHIKFAEVLAEKKK